MNYIAFDPTNLSGEQREWWSRWCDKAKNATIEAIQQAENGEEVVFQSAIWSELKRWLLKNVFNGKCAYCESPVTITDYGDADHYRPKASLAGVPGHPGYYWIAYDWRNLIPSCGHCNRGGKRDSFPITGRRAFSQEEAADPSALDVLEEPLLLHPYNYGEDNPRRHLVFTVYGQVKERNGSEKGRCSIEVYDLCRDELKIERSKSQRDAWLWYCSRLSIPDNENLKEERSDFLIKLRDGKEKHSAAVLDYIDQRIDMLRLDQTQCQTMG